MRGSVQSGAKRSCTISATSPHTPNAMNETRRSCGTLEPSGSTASSAPSPKTRAVASRCSHGHHSRRDANRIHSESNATINSARGAPPPPPRTAR